MWTRFQPRPISRITRLNNTLRKRWMHQVKVGSQGSYLHHPGTEPLLYDTLGDVIAKTVDKYPNRVAVKSMHENVAITYEELLRQADSLGCALRAQGLQKGDCVGVWSHNCVAWVVAVIAAARAGLVSVLINPANQKSELSYCLKKVGIKSLIIGEQLPNRQYFNILSQILPDIRTHKKGSIKSKDFPKLMSIINAGKEDLAGTIPLESLVAGSGSQITQYGGEIKHGDGCIIHLTSGTTGNPKAPLDSHLGVVNNTYFIGKRNLFHEGHKKICLQAPLFHALGSIVTSLSGLQHGSTLVLAAPLYSIDANIHALFAEKCSAITGTPTMYVDMLPKIKSMGDVPIYLRTALAAGAPCSPQLIKDMHKYLKTDAVMGLYGLSETVAGVFQSLPGDSVDTVADTVGYLHDHLEVKVVDDKGCLVPFGSPGELMVRGYCNMIEYCQDPEKTKETIDDEGWLATGDKFTINEEGYGRIVGRFKDIIIRGGENIAPKEIEDLLNTHPDVIESQVVGVPDERLGEELCAVVRVREGATFTVDDVTKHCNGRIAKFKIPKILKQAQDFPKTTSGKIQKYKLKDIIESGKL